MHLLALVKAYLLKRKHHKIRIKRFNKPKRSATLFSKKYPHYKMGSNCYGVPNIKNPHPDATLSIGHYCSIANNVNIYLGGNHRTDWITSYPFPHFFPEAEISLITKQLRVMSLLVAMSGYAKTQSSYPA